MMKRILKLAGLLLVAGIGLYCLDLAIPKQDYFVERPGTIDMVDHSGMATAESVKETVHLETSTGLAVDMRVLRPALADEPLPFVLVLGGHDTGKDAVDLVGDPGSIAYAAIDYPYAGQKSIRGFWQSVSAVPDIGKAFLDAPPALSVALTWALQQPWIDRNRIELVGVSLGVPFAAVAAAVDTRFTRLWLLHGGGDNVAWVDHAGRKAIENDALRNIAARSALFLVYGNSFNTPKRIAAVAPRPLIIVVACNDDYVPREAQVPLIAASSGDNVELIWTEGQHIGPERGNELQQLLEIVTGRVARDERTLSADCGAD